MVVTKTAQPTLEEAMEEYEVMQEEQFEEDLGTLLSEYCFFKLDFCEFN